MENDKLVDFDHVTDYIRREVAVSQIFDKVWTKTDEDGYIWVLRRDVIHTLDDIPAADVRPVVRGKWIGEDCSYWRNYHSGARPVRRIRYKCSVCGRTENQKEQFCNCGADMREVTSG